MTCMQQLLTGPQRAKLKEFTDFASRRVAPFAREWDRQQRIPESVIAELARAGYLGCLVPEQYGGRGWNTVTFGLLNEALGQHSSALTNVLTVQSMVSKAVLKWGTREHKDMWLPRLAKGETVAGFALTEPGAGSDLQSLTTSLKPGGAGFLLNGTKRWISCGQFAGVFLVFARLGEHSVACLVPRDAPGLRIEPITGMMGFRAAGLAQLEFENVEVPSAAIVGKPGFALSHVAPVGLHFGRLSTACSALGLIKGCFEQSIAHAARRGLGGKTVGDLGMIRSLIARMGTDLEAASLLCRNACRAEDEGLPDAYEKALMAKYNASRAAVRAATDAVQIRGASGCHESSPVSRYYRDAKIMEIIEGTTQVHEDLLGGMLVNRGRAVAEAAETGDGGAPAGETPGEPHISARMNRTEVPFPDDVTVQALIEARVEKHPRATAVICDHDRAHGRSSLTYAELNAKANQLAHLLKKAGTGPGDIVALMVDRSYAMMIGILGVIKAGGAYLPIAPDSPVDRTAYLLEDARVDVLLTRGEAAGARDPGVRVIDLDDPEIYRGPAENPGVVSGPGDLAYVIYTSGSTGKPKGVMIEHRSLVNRLHWMQHAYPIGEGDVIIQKTPYYFDVSVWELFWWALEGATLCFLAPGGERNPLILVDTIKKHGVSVMHFVPSMLNVFLEYLEGKPDRVVDGLGSVRQVFASGEALTASHVKKFNDLWGGRTGARLTNLYGPTEATIDVTYFDCPSSNDFDSIPIGRPIHNTRMYVLSDGREAGVGETGELCIAGVGLARGYLNNAALTNEKFTDNPVNPGERIYRTGDVARWRSDGNIEYLGREDHQVKIRGLRIELGEIESTIREYPGISDCVAVVKKYSDNVILIIAYVVCKSDLQIENVRAYLKRHLPDYMIPSRFEKIPEMPLTPSGKADRKALPEPAVRVGA